MEDVVRSENFVVREWAILIHYFDAFSCTTLISMEAASLTSYSLFGEEIRAASLLSGVHHASLRLSPIYVAMVAKDSFLDN
jgi:hypothetical protein